MTRDGKSEPRKPRVKKSETLEVRIPYETKQAFLNACREDGTTASEVVREQVMSYLEARERSQQEKRTLVMQLPPNVRRYGPRAAAGGIAAIGLTALAVLPSAADPDFKAQFSRLDLNGDGVLSEDEFLGPKGEDGAKTNRNVVIETRSMTVSHGDGESKPAPATMSAEMKRDAFTFWMPEELGGAKEAGAAPKETQHAYKFVSRQDVRSTDGSAPDAGAPPQRISISVDDIKKEEFASIDTNKDGKVSLEEYQARQTAMLTRGFEILDTNSDQWLSEEEYAKIVAPPMVKVSIKGGPDMPEPPKIDIPGMKTVSPEAIKAAFNRLDEDNDGKLTLQEYLPKA